MIGGRNGHIDRPNRPERPVRRIGRRVRRLNRPVLSQKGSRSQTNGGQNQETQAMSPQSAFVNTFCSQYVDCVQSRPSRRIRRLRNRASVGRASPARPHPASTKEVHYLSVHSFFDPSMRMGPATGLPSRSTMYASAPGTLSQRRVARPAALAGSDGAVRCP